MMLILFVCSTLKFSVKRASAGDICESCVLDTPRPFTKLCDHSMTKASHGLTRSMVALRTDSTWLEPEGLLIPL